MFKKLKYFLIPFVIIVILQLIFISDFWNNIEHKAYDIFYLLRGEKEVSGNIAIVEIGDDTFNTLDERWPFPRGFHAHLIENLEKAGVRQIIFDIEFTEKSDPENDKKLIEVCKKYDNIIQAGKLIRTKYKNSIRKQFLTPMQELLAVNDKWGTVNISSDIDGFVRMYELYQLKRDKIKLSLGCMSLYENLRRKNLSPAENFNNTSNFLTFGDINIPKIGSKSCMINYYGPARTFATYDYSDVIDDSTFTTSFERQLETNLDQYNSLKDKFEDKIVLIGLTAVEFHDTHYTPFFSKTHELTPGVEIHANFIEMSMNRDFITEYPHLIYLLIFVVLSFILFFINLKLKPIISLFITLILALGYIVFSYILFIDSLVKIPILEIPILLILVYIVALVFHYIKTAQERKFIKNAFGQYIAPDLVEELLKDPAKLEYGGAQKEISVLYSDIVSFTPYTEGHTPKETVDILREYLTAMVEIITKNKGTLDKFVGDEIVAIFGAPLDMEDHASWACKVALEMREKMNKLHKKWENEGKDSFEIGIGINSGDVTVGNLGSEQIFDYTAIGDNMNAGARIEALTRDYETKNNIIISEATFKMAKKYVIAEYIDDTQVKGKTETIKIYELIGRKKEVSNET